MLACAVKREAIHDPSKYASLYSLLKHVTAVRHHRPRPQQQQQLSQPSQRTCCGKELDDILACLSSALWLVAWLAHT